jgi:hypothetical protein
MIYDINTKNRSFLKLAAYLRDNKVKNNKFLLTLYDESLSGLDPFSTNLTDDQKIAVFRECSINKWYFLREIVRIPVDGVIDGIRYRVNLGNLAISYLKGKNANQIVVLPRQHGKTIGVIADDAWILLFAGTNTNIIYSNKEFKDSKKNLKLFKDIKERLPKWLTELIDADKGDKDNEEYKLIANRNNTLKAMAAANSDDQADKLGRGMTVSSIHFDEFAFLNRNQIVFEAALPAWSTASENAKKNGVPYSITITTTPNNVDTPHGAFCHKMIDKAAPFNIQCFDMDDNELTEYIKKNSSNDFVFVQFTYLELGRSEKWLEQQIRFFQGDLAKVKRELLLEWPRSTDASIFTENQLDLVFMHVRPPSSQLNVNGYFIDFYESPDFVTNYIISVDVAGGLSQDSTAFSIIAPDDFRIVGDFRNNKIDTDSTKKLIETLMKDYFRNSILIVERNSYGLNIVQSLMKDRIIEPRMVSEERQALGEKTERDGFVVKKKSKNIVYGIDTTVRTRKLMLELLPEIIDTEYDKIVSEKLYRDLAGLERKRNGKIEHSSTSHDDNLMSYLIFRYALHHGSSLKNKFGISPIPTKSNIKIVSSSENLKKIEGILLQANNMENLGGVNSEIYNYLAGRQAKLQEDDGKANAFKSILDLNKD